MVHMTSCEEAAEDEEVGFDKWVRIVGVQKWGRVKCAGHRCGVIKEDHGPSQPRNCMSSAQVMRAR